MFCHIIEKTVKKRQEVRQAECDWDRHDEAGA